ncbi:hypothetical protein BU251_07505 [Candidatus Velamenicoccus archaeovorus]|uniref:HTH marR-type domain-containing protein n=1 Tax=Velamenicoccus archaeovorus TaxID=1930593 RepID=A0A410P5Z4_VELA1|nr:MarR family transcriptional regulator [Candidatus Velamenicoccus archaeovorus]QAT17573.1 hypothetical protein BU251_07505 [Candidatus Velamenicoccus archaeovorus]
MQRIEKTSEDKRPSYYLSNLRDYGKKSKWFHWHSAELFLNLIYTHDAIFNHLASKLEASGLSRSTLNILNIISRSENKGCTHRELSDLLLVSRANITELVDNLVRRNLVERQGSEKDRRLSIVKITRKGEELRNSVTPSYYLEMKKLASCLNSNERHKLNKILAKLRLKTLALRSVTGRK